jgi:hypothetical protein
MMLFFRLKPPVLLGVGALVLASLALTDSAQAVPSFSRQTGQECATCHIGSFGPQLTPYGMRFKMNGYTEANTDSFLMPVSAMAIGTFTHTQKGQDGGPAPGFSANDNAVLQEASLFLAGKITDHVGAFVQGTYSGVDKELTLDNADIRVAAPLNVAGYDVLMGLSVNNNPTLSDPFNSLPAWRFPAISSDLAPAPEHAPMLSGGLEQRVIGATGYTMIADSLYAEVGGYTAMNRSFLEKVNVLDATDPGQNVNGIAPYGRLAYFKDWKTQAVSVGIVGFAPSVRSYGVGGRSDAYSDLGLDANYTWLGNRMHMVTLAGSYIYEWQKLGETFDAGGADQLKQHLTEASLAATYTYDRTYSLGARFFSITGSFDATLYETTGSPNSRGIIFEASWTPFGKENSWAAPYANLRIGAQYTMYSEFNGARNNYDGAGRNARDNNTFMTYLATSF